MNDLIFREEATKAIEDWERKYTWDDWCYNNKDVEALHIVAPSSVVSTLPSAQPEIKPIGYRDCVNALLRMWIDNVLTDGEYNRIMDKLHKHWGMKHG